MKTMKRILNTNDKIPVTQHTAYAIPLSIILGNTANWQWVYQKFVQVYSSMINGPTIKMRMYYYDDRYAFEEKLSIKKAEHTEEIKDIVEFIIENINNLIYVQMYIDTFCIEEKRAGGHNIQRVLLFGADVEREKIYVKGYNHNLHFATYLVSFDELRKAFLSCKMEINYSPDIYPIELIEIRDNPPEMFSIEKYRKQLLCYLNSDNDKIEFMQCGRSLSELKSFGVNAYRDFEEYIKVAMDNKYRVPYHDFHLFYEHRKINLDRFKYINTLLEDKMEIDEYANIVRECNSIRMSYMKNAVKQGGLYEPIYDRDIMLHYQEQMHLINNKEIEVLDKMMQKLNYSLPIVS